MPITYQEIEERVTKACEELNSQKKPNITKTARKYGAPRGRVSRRFHKKAGSSSSIGGHNKRLNGDEDRVLCTYIDFADEIGLPIREKTLVVAANSILRNHYPDPPILSKMWASRWLSRHPEYSKKTRKPLAAVRKNTHDPEGLMAWFEKLRAIRQRYGIVDADIHNMDETGFRIGVGRQHKVITKASNNRQYLSDPNNRDYITSIESISAAGDSHAPMLVLKAASLQERWIVDELNADTAITFSESGYSNDDISLVWLRHFNRVTSTKMQGLFRLLLLDGFSSHIEYDFVEYAQNNKIILFSFPPHTTHLLQPLDVVCFQPLKHYHAEAIDTAVRTGDTEFPKMEFLAIFEIIRRQTFKQSTVISAFRKTDIVPYNPSEVIRPLEERIKADRRARSTELARQMIAEDEEGNTALDDPPTPINVTQLWSAGEDLLNSLAVSDISPLLRTQIEKYIRGASIRIDFGEQIEKDLQTIEAAQTARTARNTTSLRTVQGGGILSIEEARRRIKQRLLGDQKAEIARFNRLLKREKRALLVEFDKAAAVARERIRRKGLLEHYLQEF
jgi:DDE superfamily endonuclease/Tc5 transposase DNA-binding domain